MPKPLVSVVIPCFNGAEDVAGAIDSALAQQNCEVEVIVINDGSSDETANVLNRYGDRIRTVHQENRGLPKTRNLGIELALGEWVAFLDHDDLWMPDKLQKQLEGATTEDAGVVYTNTLNFGDSDRVDSLRHVPDQMPQGDLFEALLMDNFLVTSSLMVRRTILDSVGRFTESPVMAEDWDLWLKIAAAGHRFVPVREPLTRYRWRAGSFSKHYDRMRRYRELALHRALASARGKKLPWSVRRKALANVQNCSAWFLAASSPRRAIKWYAQSIYYWPFDITSWKGIVKGCLGRS
ncbi:MAG: glycosyltransferase [Planctomyces sp.]|nr:glycosyltransferase [Planctomyces sp.]